ncbi:MAG: ADP-ribosylglycohydrolase family protein [Herpetosiphon sp.]
MPRKRTATPSTTPALDRYTGTLVGGAIGDALGRPVEGRSPAQLQARYGELRDYHRWHGWKSGPRGTITDDTQLTMLIAESLLAQGFIDPDDIARRLVDWLPIGRGKGHATTAAVRRLERGVPWYSAGEESAGNGAAMRSAPVGLRYWNDPIRLRHAAVLSALPTHRHPMGIAGAVAMAAATAWLVTCSPADWSPAAFVAAVQKAIMGLETEAVPERRDPNVRSTLHDRIGELPTLLETPPHDVFARLFNGAYVLESLPAALYCFMRTPHDVEQTLLLAVNAGHDADTVAAMAATLGGALNGYNGLPARLLPELEFHTELVALATALHEHALRDRVAPPPTSSKPEL